MKKLCFLVALIVWMPFGGHGQSLIELNKERIQTNQRGMLVLGSWALGNIAYSTVRYSMTSGETERFHQMNIWWNVVNLGIAGVSYLGARKEMGKELTLSESVRAQQMVEKAFLFNAGLDVGYMAAGLYLREVGNNRREIEERNRFGGWGKSLVLQGGFLMVYDVAMYLAHRKHGNRGVMKLLEHVEVTGMGLGLHIPIGAD